MAALSSLAGDLVELTLTTASILIGAGLVAGVVNTLAGGGSLLTVSLLVVLGLPGTVANGTNRIGILVQNATAVWRFRAEGVPGVRDAIPVLVPTLLGSVAGAFSISLLSDETFERLFGVAMLLLLWPMLRPRRSADEAPEPAPWHPLLRFGVFFAIGFYGGAIQAGVGIALVLALSHAGIDLVRANSIKVVVVGALTLVAVPVFVLDGKVEWIPALVLTVGFVAGAALGTRLAVRGGERVIRPVLVVAVVALAGRMLGFY